DSSGNESARSAVASASTNPPTHTIFPIPVSGKPLGAVAIDHLYPGYPLDLVVGSDFLYVWHADGNAPVDADGAGASSGDFSLRGGDFAASPSIGDIDGDGVKDIVAISADSTRIYAFDLTGATKPGWPRVIDDGSW